MFSDLKKKTSKKIELDNNFHISFSPPEKYAKSSYNLLCWTSRFVQKNIHEINKNLMVVLD